MIPRCARILQVCKQPRARRSIEAGMNHRKPIVPAAFFAAIAVALVARPAPVEAAFGIGEDAPATHLIEPNMLIGKVELSPGVPCAGCTVVVENTALGVRPTDTDGFWKVDGLPPGLWTVVITHPTLGSKRLSCGEKEFYYGRIVQCPTVVMALPGAVSGRVTLPSTVDYDTAVVGIPELGIFAPLNGGGPGYVLTGVAPGWRKLVVRTNTSWNSLWVFIQPAQVSMNMNVAVPSVPPLLLQ
jgi:hypothetical protein